MNESAKGAEVLTSLPSSTQLPISGGAVKKPVFGPRAVSMLERNGQYLIMPKKTWDERINNHTGGSFVYGRSSRNIVMPASFDYPHLTMPVIYFLEFETKERVEKVVIGVNGFHYSTGHKQKRYGFVHCKDNLFQSKEYVPLSILNACKELLSKAGFGSGCKPEWAGELMPTTSTQTLAGDDFSLSMANKFQVLNVEDSKENTTFNQGEEEGSMSSSAASPRSSGNKSTGKKSTPVLQEKAGELYYYRYEKEWEEMLADKGLLDNKSFYHYLENLSHVAIKEDEREAWRKLFTMLVNSYNDYEEIELNLWKKCNYDDFIDQVILNQTSGCFRKLIKNGGQDLNRQNMLTLIKREEEKLKHTLPFSGKSHCENLTISFVDPKEINSFREVFNIKEFKDFHKYAIKGFVSFLMMRLRLLKIQADQLAIVYHSKLAFELLTCLVNDKCNGMLEGLHLLTSRSIVFSNKNQKFIYVTLLVSEEKGTNEEASNAIENKLKFTESSYVEYFNIISSLNFLLTNLLPPKRKTIIEDELEMVFKSVPAKMEERLLEINSKYESAMKKINRDLKGKPYSKKIYNLGETMSKYDCFDHNKHINSETVRQGFDILYKIQDVLLKYQVK